MIAAKPLSNVSQANCSAGNSVLAALSEQNPIAAQRALNSAKARYDDSYRSILEAVGTGAFKTPFDGKKLESIRKYPYTDLSKVTTHEDLLRQIAAIVKSSSEALARIQSGNADKGDLSLVIDNSAEITRLIAMFYNISVA